MTSTPEDDARALNDEVAPAPPPAESVAPSPDEHVAPSPDDTPPAPDDAAREKAAYALVSEIALRDEVDERALRRVTLLGPPAIPALREAVGFRERAVRRFAVQALAAIGTRRAIAPLLNVIDAARDVDADLTAIALRGVIPSLEADDADRVGSFLVELAGHPDRFVRAAVADGLSRLGPDAFEDTLRQLVRDLDPFVAERAALALGSAAAPDAPEADGLVNRLAAHDGPTRLDAVAELAARDDRATFIATQLVTPHPRIRRGLLEAAARAGDPALALPLLELADAPATGDHDRALALRGVVWSEALDLAALGRALDRYSQSADLFVRAEAFAAGVRAGVPYADELFDRGLRDPAEHVRERVLEAWLQVDLERSGPTTPAVVDRVRAQTASLASERGEVDDAEHGALWEGLARRVAHGAYVDADLADVAGRSVALAEPAGRAGARAFLEAWTGGGAPAPAKAGAATIGTWLASGDADARVRALDALEASPRLVPGQLDALLRALYVASPPEIARIAALLAHAGDPRADSARERLRVHPDAAVRQAAGALPEATNDGRAVASLEARERSVTPGEDA